jgi:hypothetical protein
MSLSTYIIVATTKLHCGSPQIALLICLFFAEADSEFLNGYPLVLLSAPVFRLILPLLVANSIHQRPIEAKPADPMADMARTAWPPELNLA